MLNITSYAKHRMVEWYTSKFPASQLYFLGISTRLKFIPSQKKKKYSGDCNVSDKRTAHDGKDGFGLGLGQRFPVFWLDVYLLNTVDYELEISILW